MPVTFDVNENTVCAHLSGELDHHAAREMREAIDEMIGRRKPDKLILDFKDITFMDSSGIGLVMGRYKLLSSYGASVVLVNTSPHITKVMKLSGLDRLAVIGERGNDTDESK